MVLAGVQSDLTISNNDLVNDSTLVLFGTTNGSVTANNWTNATGSAIYLGGGNNGVVVVGNTLANSNRRFLIAENVSGTNINLTVNGNTVAQAIGQLTATSPNQSLSMIDLRGTGGTTLVNGNAVTFSGTSYGANVIAARAIAITNASGTVSVGNSLLSGGNAPATTGVLVSGGTAPLTLTNNSIAGFAVGGTLTSVATVNYVTRDPGVDNVTVDASSVQDNGNQGYTYSGIAALNVATLGGDDLINILGAGVGLTINVDGGAGANTLNYETGSGDDDVRYRTSGTAPLGFQIFKTDGTQTVNLLNIATRRIRTHGGNDTVTFDRVGGSIAADFIIETGDGDDTVLAGLGNDTIRGGAGNDSLSGANGNDFIDGEDGDDVLFGGVGDDTLVAGTGSNELYGQNGNDTLFARNLIVDIVDGGVGLDAARIDGFDLTSGVESFLA
jgi:hypothetical protein